MDNNEDSSFKTFGGTDENEVGSGVLEPDQILGGGRYRLVNGEGAPPAGGQSSGRLFKRLCLYVLPVLALIIILSFFFAVRSAPLGREAPRWKETHQPRPQATQSTVSTGSDLSTAGEKAGERRVLTLKGVEYAFRWCPAGSFMMGSPESEEGRKDYEMQHRVTLSQGFWLLETEVTQEMWESVMGNNPSYFKGSKFLPVECVSWEDSQEFLSKLNEESKFHFRLPSEAEWEYACRAGTTTPFSFGSVLNGDKTNCNGKRPYGTATKGRSLGKTSEVGSYAANAWGLYDMPGNVCEWCNDWWSEDYYKNSPVTDPMGPNLSDSSRVNRGGCWFSSASWSRSANRSRDVPTYRLAFLGFRAVVVPSE